MIRAVLIDLSGTLHIENEAIPGAIEALKRLFTKDLHVKFVTNTTKESQNYLYNRLKQLGFPIDKKQIYTSLTATRKLIENEKLKPIFLVAPEALEDFQGLTCPIKGEKPNAVVIGLAPTEFHYNRLNEAFRCLLDGAKLIAVHAGRYHKQKDGLSLGPGCFVKGLEYSAQCTAHIVGKPNKSFFQSAIDDFNGNVECSQTVMIGDDVNDDVKGAIEAGMQGILVQTGKYRTGDENKIKNLPHFCVPSFKEAVDQIFSQLDK